MWSLLQSIILMKMEVITDCSTYMSLFLLNSISLQFDLIIVLFSLAEFEKDFLFM